MDQDSAHASSHEAQSIQFNAFGTTTGRMSVNGSARDRYPWLYDSERRRDDEEQDGWYLDDGMPDQGADYEPI